MRTLAVNLFDITLNIASVILSLVRSSGLSFMSWVVKHLMRRQPHLRPRVPSPDTGAAHHC